MKSYFAYVDQAHMEYQKRLKFIDYIKKNYFICESDVMVFNFENFDNLDMVTAWKIRTVEDRVNYFLGRQDRGLGTCMYSYVFAIGKYIDFSDSYLDYEEIVCRGRCINNSLNQSIKQTQIDIQNEIEGLVDELNGKERVYRKSNC